MVEETQAHFSALGVKPPAHLTTDQRHAESSLYAFLDYDILREEDDQEDMSHEFNFDLKNHSDLILRMLY